MICFASNPFSNLSNSNDLYECIKLLDLMVTHEYTICLLYTSRCV